MEWINKATSPSNSTQKECLLRSRIRPAEWTSTGAINKTPEFSSIPGSTAAGQPDLMQAFGYCSIRSRVLELGRVPTAIISANSSGVILIFSNIACSFSSFSPLALNRCDTCVAVKKQASIQRGHICMSRRKWELAIGEVASHSKRLSAFRLKRRPTITFFAKWM